MLMTSVTHGSAVFLIQLFYLPSLDTNCTAIQVKPNLMQKGKTKDKFMHEFVVPDICSSMLRLQLNLHGNLQLVRRAHIRKPMTVRHCTYYD